MLFKCLVVDDDVEEAEALCDELNEISRRNFLNYVGQDLSGHSLFFEPFSVHEGEYARDFFERFSEFTSSRQISTEESPIQLSAIIFDWRLELMNPAEDEFPQLDGIVLAKEIRRRLPSVDRILLTRHSLEATEYEDGDLFSRSFMKQDCRNARGKNNLFRIIAEGIRTKFHTPYWDSLKSFAVSDKLVMHAMAAADDKAAGGGLIDDFVDFFGPNYFNAESSSTIDPLDSLLAPKGSLKAAQEVFAASFGGDHAFFVTAGTSTANRILHQSVTSRGDYVILDDTCHISHHFAVATVDTQPIYLPTKVCSNTGISFGIDVDTVASTVENFLNAQRDGSYILPSLIALTNTSFDGIGTSPSGIINAVYNVLSAKGISHRLREIVFLFDEAWFSYGRFHPDTSAYSSLTDTAYSPELSRIRKDVRLYVTQSVHKTLFAFRQSSVILVKDPYFDQGSPDGAISGVRPKFMSAYLASTTTSPHAGMLASLDVARRQIVMEGSALVESAKTASIELTRSINEPVSILDLQISEVFRAVEVSEITEHLNLSSQFVDITKLTLKCKYDVGGPLLKSIFWERGGIQVNKSGPTSVLLIFTPGPINSIVADLKTRLGRISAFVKQNFSKLTADRFELNPGFLRKSGPLDRVFQSGDTAISIEEAISMQRRISIGEWIFGHDQRRSKELKIDPEIKDSRVVMASFITPYPPGYPVFVPGESVAGSEIFDLVDGTSGEIHGVFSKGAGSKSVSGYITDG